MLLVEPDACDERRQVLQREPVDLVIKDAEDRQARGQPRGGRIARLLFGHALRLLLGARALPGGDLRQDGVFVPERLVLLPVRHPLFPRSGLDELLVLLPELLSEILVLLPQLRKLFLQPLLLLGERLVPLPERMRKLFLQLLLLGERLILLTFERIILLPERLPLLRKLFPQIPLLRPQALHLFAYATAHDAGKPF